jgi:hypothetical protein
MFLPAARFQTSPVAYEVGSAVAQRKAILAKIAFEIGICFRGVYCSFAVKLFA